MKQIVLDTETTGLNAKLGDRIIEIGCIEVLNRRRTGRVFHRYLRPDREIDPGALQVHALRLAGDERQALYRFVVQDEAGRTLVDGRAAVVFDSPLSVP